MKKTTIFDTLKAILFDMVGVLIFKKSGYVPITVDELNALNIEKLYNHIDDQKLLKDIKQKLLLDNHQIKKALLLIPAKFEIFSDLWDMLPMLKKNYKLAIINNGNALAKDYWNAKFNFSIFDLFINSAIEKIRKPDPAIYLLACKRLGVRPKNCLFIDDSIVNIKSAKKIGMKTLWWSQKKRRERNLQSFIKLISENQTCS